MHELVKAVVSWSAPLLPDRTRLATSSLRVNLNLKMSDSSSETSQHTAADALHTAFCSFPSLSSCFIGKCMVVVVCLYVWVNICIVSPAVLPEIEHIWRQRVHEGTEADPLSSILPADHHRQRTNGRGWAPAFQSEPEPVWHLGAQSSGRERISSLMTSLQLIFTPWLKACPFQGLNRGNYSQHILYYQYISSPFEAFKIRVMERFIFCIFVWLRHYSTEILVK